MVGVGKLALASKKGGNNAVPFCQCNAAVLIVEVRSSTSYTPKNLMLLTLTTTAPSVTSAGWCVQVLLNSTIISLVNEQSHSRQSIEKALGGESKVYTW